MSDERLGSTLFLAALVHGVVILGVTFTAAPLDDEVAAPSLNVTLVLDTEREELARRHGRVHRQSRSTRRRPGGRGLRPTSTLSADQPVTQAGDPNGADAADGTPRDETPSAEQAREPRPSSASSCPRCRNRRTILRRRGNAPRRSFSKPRRKRQPWSSRCEPSCPNGSDDARTLIATPSTRQSGLAEYLDGWRRRVERIGTANYPRELLGNLARVGRRSRS